jgi:hypothetical protein
MAHQVHDLHVAQQVTIQNGAAIQDEGFQPGMRLLRRPG